MAFPSSLYNKHSRGLRLTPRGRAFGIVALLMAVGLALSAVNAPLASSAGSAIEVVHIAEAVPLEAQSPLWDRTQDVEIPLSAQQIYQPGGGTTRMVMVKVLEDGHNISFRVSWDDDTRNDVVGNVPSDAAAIQLPLEPTNLPYQCMGQSLSKVNIWQWKATLEKEGLDNLGAMAQANPGVRNMTSNGICKAVETPGAEPHVTSYHDGKMWHVVFNRALSTGDPGTAPLHIGLNTSVAFAVWNGARGEARGMKAVSTWNTLLFPSTPESSTSGLLTLGAVILVSAGAVAYAMRRMAG